MYGLELYSATDNSLLISSEVDNCALSGVVSRTGYTKKYPDAPQGPVTVHFSLPSYSTTTPPAIFMELPTIAIRLHKLYYSSGVWRLDVVTNYANSEAPQDFKVYCFEPIRLLSPTSSGYGLEMYNDSGELTYTSEGGLKLLAIDHIVDTHILKTTTSYPIEGMPTRAAAAFNINGAHYTYSNPYTFFYVKGLEREGDSIKYTLLLTDYIVGEASPSSDEGGYDTYCSVPIIDCSRYD